jgi:purine nucleosidase
LMAKKRVIIDADPATGVRFKDVDDGLAFLLMIASPEIIIEGITINFGNVKAPLGYAIAREVLEVAGADIPVYRGAESSKQLGRSNRAVEYLIDTVNRNPGEISLLTLAPLTNVATAMILDGGFASKLGELVVMGGSINFKPFSFFGEFNFHLDGSAASAVISAPVQKTMITMDVCSQAVFRKEHLQRFREHDSRVSRYLAEKIPHWLKVNRMVFFRKGGFFPWDVVAAAHLIDPSLFDANPYTVSLQGEGIRSGRITNLLRCDSFDGRGDIVPLNVPLRLDAVRFMDLFIERLLSL